MGSRSQRWAQRHPVATTVLLNVVMISTTLVFTVIAIGPDRLLDQDCTGSKCVSSHGVAAIWAVFSAVVTVLVLRATIRAVRQGRFKRPE
jgi:hypothetical protein